MTVYFSNERFPNAWGQIANGNDRFLTEIVSTDGGVEQRKTMGFRPAEFTINADGGLAYDDPELSYKLLDNHHKAMRGAFISFRFKNILNYQATKNEGFIGKGARGNGYPSQYLYKKYSSGGYSTFKRIVLPIVSTFKAYINGVYDSRCTVNQYTGQVTFPPLKNFSISSIANGASTVVITLDRAHTFFVGEVVYLNITNTASPLYKQAYPVLEVTERTITIGAVNNSSVGSQSSVQSYIQSSDSCYAEFEFDYPVRYDVDSIDMQKRGDLITFQQFKLIEVFDDLTLYSGV